MEAISKIPKPTRFNLRKQPKKLGEWRSVVARYAVDGIIEYLDVSCFLLWKKHLKSGFNNYIFRCLLKSVENAQELSKAQSLWKIRSKKFRGTHISLIKCILMISFRVT